MSFSNSKRSPYPNTQNNCTNSSYTYAYIFLVSHLRVTGVNICLRCGVSDKAEHVYFRDYISSDYLFNSL